MLFAIACASHGPSSGERKEGPPVGHSQAAEAACLEPELVCRHRLLCVWLGRLLPVAAMAYSLICSMERYSRAYGTCLFLDMVWRWYNSQVRIFAFLEPRAQCLFARSCVVAFVERVDLSFSATGFRLGMSEQSTWAVPTPPVAFYSIDEGQ